MRHRKATSKLGRKTEHRQAMLANQVCSLIQHDRIKTTLAKAKAVRPLAEKMVTLGKAGTLHARRNAMAVLGQKDAISKLFSDIASRCASRSGGYTRIIKLGPRLSDSAPMAFIEWVDSPAGDDDSVSAPVETEKAPAKSKGKAKKESAEPASAADEKSAKAKSKKSKAKDD
jgi:large subunit ribosomal protein L17